MNFWKAGKALGVRSVGQDIVWYTQADGQERKEEVAASLLMFECIPLEMLIGTLAFQLVAANCPGLTWF